ncbi:uncharacterized protein LOC129597201 [Paramacrobiotus metropolitanus]|uniref:uncharacterized protein LOC129597201 n=1 Tax=Paramacrobiotus metropolitanus TaxID=2943436 RepID=UPI0024456A8D|nr:uncharacterized protein LOC129597201 [Paramacrobiotus metropolitanus]
MPLLPPTKTPAVNLLYKIPTDQFVCGAINTSKQIPYTADISVDADPTYPDIPASVWTVTMLVTENSAAVTATVCPKEPSANVKSSNAISVECRVRASADGPCDIRIEETGWRLPTASGTNLMELVTSTYSSGYTHYALKRGVVVFVNLTFYVAKKAEDAIAHRQDMKQLLDSRMLTDFKLVCGGKDIAVHRAIVAAQSPVFAAMFQNDMEEKNTGQCEINDISPDVLEAMIQFAYTRSPLEANDMLTDLWMAAEKYDMVDLRAECETMMAASLTKDNVVQRLCFAENHDLKKLRTSALAFIGRHVEEIE